MWKFRQSHTIGVLLIITNAAYSVVLLTANIEDVRNIARKFVSASEADKLTQFIAEASVIKPTNISADNKQNEKNVLDREWNTYHYPPKDSFSSSDENIKIIKGNSNLDSANNDEEQATGSIQFLKGKHRDINLNKPKKEKDFGYEYGLKQENLKTPKFEWKKAENFDFPPSYNTNYLSNLNPYLDNSQTFPIEDNGNFEISADSEMYSLEKHNKPLGSPYERPQIDMEQSIKEINISTENPLETDTLKYTYTEETGSTKLNYLYSIFEKTETQTEDNNKIKNSNYLKNDILATSERTELFKPSTELIDSSEEDSSNNDNKNYLQKDESDTNYELDLRNYLKRIVNEIKDEESRRIQYRATDDLKDDKNIIELKSNDKKFAPDTNLSDMEKDNEYELLSKKYSSSEIDTENEFENNNLGKTSEDIITREKNQKRVLVRG
ncbi:unnamed protein product [Parnassius apollo]|uniref:(apollo) hypothetical protein n=1 Tax=Parnassius apollo TaxID=110799 RepID=A0A8S3X536_PARAO|nr:unnamed protein product [Parnassius apollo]